jgi:hypothetical protein
MSEHDVYDASTYIGYLKQKNGGFKIVGGEQDNKIIKNRDYILKELLGGLKNNNLNISRFPEYFSALEGKYIRNVMQGSGNTDAIVARQRTKKITEKTIKGGFKLYGDKVKNILEINAPVLYKKFEKKFKVAGGVSTDINNRLADEFRKKIDLDGGKRRFSLVGLPKVINPYTKIDYINNLIQQCKDYLSYYEKVDNEDEYDLYYTMLQSILNSNDPINIISTINLNSYKAYTKYNEDNYSESESESESDSDKEFILTKKQKQIKIDNVIKYIAITILHYYLKLNTYSINVDKEKEYSELIINLNKISKIFSDKNLTQDDIKSIIRGVTKDLHKWHSDDPIVVFN